MSLERADIRNFNDCNEGGTQSLTRRGYRMGRMRAIFTATGGAASNPNAVVGGPYNLVGMDGQVAYVPSGITITRVVTKALTSFTSGTSAATISLGVNTGSDLVAAAAVSGAWQAGATMVTGIPVMQTLSTWVTVPVTTLDKVPLTATVGVEALTAGKLVMFLDWVFWGDIPLT